MTNRLIESRPSSIPPIFSNPLQSSRMTAPSMSSIQAFERCMNCGGMDSINGHSAANASLYPSNAVPDASPMMAKAMTGSAPQSKELSEKLSKLVILLYELIATISAMNQRSSDAAVSAVPVNASLETMGGSIPISGSSEIRPVEGSGFGGSAGSNELIPQPVEHLQKLNLGDKPVTVGGDGSASAAEVKATADTIQNLYDTSPTFRGMIDNSSDPSFEVSVGKRGDNTSWGNTGGKVFMNINNIAPGNHQAFQGLLAHEFAHASIDLPHGSELDAIENRVPQEARAA